MATNVTQSLFGMTPQAIQSQRAADLQAQALQFAKLTPMQQAQAGLFTAGSQLGTGIAGLMGYEDPEMQQAKARQGMLGGVDMNDPQALLTLAKSIQGTDPQAAQMLVMQANELATKQAATRKTEADMLGEQQGYQMRFEALKKRMPEMSDEEARAIAQDPAAFRKFLETPKVDTQVVETADGQILINKQTGQPIANLGRAPDRRPTTNVNVDTRGAGNALGIVRDFDSAVKEPLAAYRDAQMAKTLINESMASNNSQAWEQARTLLAKATGQGRLSNEDIRRTGVDPRFVQGVADWVNKKTVGVPNEDIRRQLYIVAAHLERQMGNTINQTAQRARNIGEMEGVDPAKLDTFFPGVPVNNSPRRSTTGGGGTVNWSDLQ
jgi:hypothetical protein